MSDETNPTPPETPETPPTPEPEPAPAPPPPGDDAAAPAFADLKDDEKTMGMLCHLLGLITGFVGPLVLWLIKKEESKFIEDQAKEALNFQIMMFLGMFISGILMIVCIGYLTFLAVLVVDIIFTIQGMLKAKEGQAYRYPFNLRLIK
ncbi:MAG: DUF4870 domain-containing protein [Phycisphaerales bacterium JB063]